MLCPKYIQLRQKSLLSKFVQINTHLNAKLYSMESKDSNYQKQLIFYWWFYLKLNRTLTELSQTIKQYNRYCSPLISIIVPFYISVQCYLLFIVFKVTHIPLIWKQLFLIDVSIINLFLLIIITQCAGVVKINQRLEFESRRFCMLVFQQQKKEFRLIGCRNMLKVYVSV